LQGNSVKAEKKKQGMKKWKIGVRRPVAKADTAKRVMINSPIIINSFFEHCTISEVNMIESAEKEKTMNEVITENPLKTEAFQALNQIFESGNETLIQYTAIQLKTLLSKSTEKGEKTTTTQMITGVDHPADNLHCLKSMTDFMKASVIGIACADGSLSRTEWDGFAYMLGIISNDMKAIADNL